MITTNPQEFLREGNIIAYIEPKTSSYRTGKILKILSGSVEIETSDKKHKKILIKSIKYGYIYDSKKQNS